MKTKKDVLMPRVRHLQFGNSFGGVCIFYFSTCGVKMKIEIVKTSEIKPYEKNPRKNDHAVDAVARSIQEFGFRQPIVLDRDGVIVVGHTRWKAAKKLGMETVPVHYANDLTPDAAKAYRIADNKLVELAEWDFPLLAEEMNLLIDAKFDIETLAFDDAEIEKILGAEYHGNAGIVDEDSVCDVIVRRWEEFTGKKSVKMSSEIKD